MCCSISKLKVHFRCLYNNPLSQGTVYIVNKDPKTRAIVVSFTHKILGIRLGYITLIVLPQLILPGRAHSCIQDYEHIVFRGVALGTFYFQADSVQNKRSSHYYSTVKYMYQLKQMPELLTIWRYCWYKQTVVGACNNERLWKQVYCVISQCGLVGIEWQIKVVHNSKQLWKKVGQYHVLPVQFHWLRIIYIK